MRIKDLFTVPEGKKITEKIFGRVLLSSICGILLCMACLAGTTWAWFAVTLENNGNEIQIATISPDIEITCEGVQVTASETGSFILTPGTYNVQVKVESDAVAPEGMTVNQNPVYAIMSVDDGQNVRSYLYQFDSYGDVKFQTVTVTTGSAEVSFFVSWVKPSSVLTIDQNPLVIGAGQP